MDATKLRALVLDGKGTVEVVEHDGAKFELRSPSFEQRMAYLNALNAASAGKPAEEMTMADKAQELTGAIKATLAVLVTVTHDENGKLVFAEGDVEALFRARTGPLLTKLIKATRSLLDERVSELGKESGQTSTSSSPA